MKYIKKSILVSLAIVLTVTALVSTPAVDRIQLEDSWQYTFFYAYALPPIYYVASIYLALLAIFGGGRSIKLLSVMLVALLVEFTPSIMLANPWLPDQYPYLAEAEWLVKEGHIANMHYLDQVPGLGLMYSQLMLVTGLGPFDVSDMYPCVMVLAIMLPLFLLSEELCGNGALAPLLFLSSNFSQINTFHRSSQFVMLFSILAFLLIRRSNQVEAVERSFYSILCMLTFLTAVLTYPGSIIIVTMALVSLVLANFLKLKRYFELTLGLLFSAIFLAWNMFVSEGEFRFMVGNVYLAIQELNFPQIPITPGKVEATQLTPVFDAVVQARMAITLLLLSVAGIYTVYTMLKRGKTPGQMPTLLFFGIVVSVAPFIATGESRWFVLKFAPYMLVSAALCVVAFIGHGAYKRIRLSMVLAIILIGLVALPVLRYSSIPYLHVTTEELSAVRFVHTYHNELEPIYYVEYPPYTLPRLQLGKDLSWEVTQVFPTELETAQKNFLTSGRLLTRDGYYVHYMGSYREYLESLISELETTHNVVYTSGDYVQLFFSRS